VLNRAPAAFTTRRNRPGQGPGLVLVLVLLSALAPLSTDMYLAAFPGMAAEFGVGASTVQLTLTAFMVGLGVGQFVIGPISDSLGRRRLLLTCLFVCLLASVVCALAPSAAVLIGARAVQGALGGAGMVLGRAIIADRTRGPATLRFMNALMAAGSIAAVVSPVIGGQIVAWSGWRPVFWTLTGVVAFTLAVSVLVVPETLPRHLRHGGGFAEFTRGIGHVLSDRAYAAYLLTSMGTHGAFFAYISGSPFVLQEHMGIGVRTFSFVFGVNAVGLVLATVLSIRLVSRVNALLLVRAGVGIVAVATAVLLVLVHTGLPTMPMLVTLFIAVAAQGLVAGNVTGLAVSRARAHAGTASALLGALPFGFSAVMMPIVGLGYQPRTLGIVMLSCAVLAMAAVLWVPAAPPEATSPEP